MGMGAGRFLSRGDPKEVRGVRELQNVAGGGEESCGKGGRQGEEVRNSGLSWRWRIMIPFVIWFNDPPPSGLAVTCHPLPRAPLTPGVGLEPLSTWAPLPLHPSGLATSYSLAHPPPGEMCTSVGRDLDAIHL